MAQIQKGSSVVETRLASLSHVLVPEEQLSTPLEHYLELKQIFSLVDGNKVFIRAARYIEYCISQWYAITE